MSPSSPTVGLAAHHVPRGPAPELIEGHLALAIPSTLVPAPRRNRSSFSECKYFPQIALLYLLALYSKVCNCLRISPDRIMASDIATPTVSP